MLVLCYIVGNIILAYTCCDSDWHSVLSIGRMSIKIFVLITKIFKLVFDQFLYKLHFYIYSSLLNLPLHTFLSSLRWLSILCSVFLLSYIKCCLKMTYLFCLFIWTVPLDSHNLYVWLYIVGETLNVYVSFFSGFTFSGNSTKKPQRKLEFWEIELHPSKKGKNTLLKDIS
jgi:hypothetical protein